MNKMIFSAGLIVAVFFLVTNSMIAQETETEKTKVEQVRSGFVDNDGDGVCDHYDGKRPGKGLGPGHGLGEGRADGKRLGQGRGLRDGSGYGERRLDGSGPGRGLRKGLRDGSGPRCRRAPQK